MQLISYIDEYDQYREGLALLRSIESIIIISVYRVLYSGREDKVVKNRSIIRDRCG